MLGNELPRGKDPRPIAIATLKNRVVQGAILRGIAATHRLDLKEQRYPIRN